MNDLPLDAICADITAATERTMYYHPGARMERSTDEPFLLAALAAKFQTEHTST
jgi:hypothetical protein